ncbi:MAG: DNA-binding protein [Janthinobacterium lividum]
MVDRTELYEVADAIRGEGKVPSLRLIRGRLKNGGSFRDVGQLFLDWCIEREFRPRPKTSDLPDHLRERLAAVAAEVWRDGHRNGILAGQDQRDLLVIERARSETLLVEALAIADALESERSRLLEEVRTIKANRGPEAVPNGRLADMTVPNVPPPDELLPRPLGGSLRKLARRMRDQDEWEPDIEDRAAKG